MTDTSPKDAVSNPQDSIKVALITGGVSKIGRHITTRLHERGYNVAIHYHTAKDAAQRLEGELNRIRQNSAFAIQADLSTSCRENVRRLVGIVKAEWNRIDVIVNNASVFCSTKVEDCSEDDWTTTMNVNVTSPFFLIQSASKDLTVAKGCVVNICDVHGTRPLKDYAVYSVSKSALIALTKSLAKELGGVGVRVNGVSPGAISLEGDEPIKGQSADNITSKTALKCGGSPNDISDCVEYLINGSYVTGQIINVDGGWTLNQ